MTVLVTAASKHGATSEIAARIGAGLAERGVEVEVKEPEEVHELDQYDAFVVGSGVYMGKWLKPARSFVDAHAGELAPRPTWLFSSGPIVGDPTRPADPQDAAQGNSLAETVQAREHRLFAGKLDKTQLSFVEKAAVRAAHAHEATTATGTRSTNGQARSRESSSRLTSARAASEASDKSPGRGGRPNSR